MEKEEQVVLVDASDHIIGYMDKTTAHQEGRLHRAISILLYNSKGDMIIQQRADHKYHWAGIWSNACCSHPRKDESYIAAAERRLFEELGINTPLNHIFTFTYKAEDPASGLTEHELDYVFEGVWDSSIPFNTDEVKAIKIISFEDLKKDIAAHPDDYSFWFKIILNKIIENETHS
jgi:isopentenyl-diphosphate delta-isomerase